MTRVKFKQLLCALTALILCLGAITTWRTQADDWMIAISGGAAGTSLPAARPSGFAGTAARWTLVRNTPAVNFSGYVGFDHHGVARFANLSPSTFIPARNDWYLLEVLAPSNYVRVESFRMLSDLTASPGIEAREFINTTWPTPTPHLSTPVG